MAKYTFEVAGNIVGKYCEVIAKSGEIIIEGEVVAIYYKEKSNYGLKLVGELGRCHERFGSLENAAKAALSHHLYTKTKA
jgi:formylmethanofuran dehydrogenase subunit C